MSVPPESTETMRYIPLYNPIYSIGRPTYPTDHLPPPPRGVDTATWLSVCLRPFTFRLGANLGILVVAVCNWITSRIPGYVEGKEVARRQLRPFGPSLPGGCPWREHAGDKATSEDWPFEPCAGEPPYLP